MNQPKPSPRRASAYRTRHEREDALRDAVRGVDLDADEERILSWIANMLDAPTAETITGLFNKVRTEGMVNVLDAENELRLRQRQGTHWTAMTSDAPTRRNPGFSGPGW